MLKLNLNFQLTIWWTSKLKLPSLKMLMQKLCAFNFYLVKTKVSALWSCEVQSMLFSWSMIFVGFLSSFPSLLIQNTYEISKYTKH